MTTIYGHIGCPNHASVNVHARLEDSERKVIAPRGKADMKEEKEGAMQVKGWPHHCNRTVIAL